MSMTKSVMLPEVIIIQGYVHNLPCQNPGFRAVFNSNTHLLDKASPGEPTVVEDSLTLTNNTRFILQ